MDYKQFTNTLIVALRSRFAMHTALLLLFLVAFTSNLLASASPTPPGLRLEQLHSLSGSGHSVVAIRGGQAHQPRELAKRYITQTDRRVMRIAINTALAASLEIAATYAMQFEYHFESEGRIIHNAYDTSNGVTMTLADSLIVNQFNNGVDIAIPAMVSFISSAGTRLLAILAWGARMRTDSHVVVGIALMELEIVTLQGIHRLGPGLYSWTFNQGLPP